MKAIISHDVDHITVWEHNKDLILAKFFVRSSMQLISRDITPVEWLNRIKTFYSNKWNNITEIMQFNKKHNVKATFFFGVNNGIGLSYSTDSARKWIKKVAENGFEIGVHGISFQDFNSIKKEFDFFQSISGLDSFGIRMHCLRKTAETLDFLDQAGYVYDTSEYVIHGPRKLAKMFEIPLHIMDGTFLYKGMMKPVKLESAIEETRAVINRAIEMELPYLTILFHDRYFCDCYKKWTQWYIWVIQYLSECRIPFIDYHDAIAELR